MRETVKTNQEMVFMEYFHEYYPGLFRFALYLLKRKDLAEDCVSDVFLSLWIIKDKLPEIQKIKPYLFTSVKNKALMIKKRMDRQETLDFNTIVEIPDVVLSPLDRLMKKELQMVIEDVIIRLPERCRMIFLLAKEEKLKYKEISNILSVSVKTIDSQISIANKRIKRALTKFNSPKFSVKSKDKLKIFA
ncbi:MAG: RNA polymerase sigma-70 factor [Bacteroidales bacterium]|nr:RNA polymerase sigma-70 factor [Bacteroidales bacterium]MDD2424654.1 RNA polymerase sigma-70 factor [Bacteroidales bacterium]MDD3989126.1 RNA polymerase sigma-70 factor [Bacteroidales bacterium]MDD4638659.1 RNA polymerase sigma-70 factor [Bacteroidales bacterium]